MLHQQDQLVNLNRNIFDVVKGKIYIGGEEIKPELRAVLKEQAKYIETSQFFEIFIATMKQEASKLALSESTEWNHVLYAKALKYLSDSFEVMINILKK